MSLRLANAALHVLHVTIIVFSCVGWIWPATRPLHLMLAGGIFISWFIIGPLIGDPGHCVVTGVQHRIWSALGQSDRPSYMSFLAQTLTGKRPNDATVARVTQLVFYATTLLSLTLWLAARAGVFDSGQPAQ